VWLRVTPAVAGVWCGSLSRGRERGCSCDTTRRQVFRGGRQPPGVLRRADLCVLCWWWCGMWCLLARGSLRQRPHSQEQRCILFLRHTRRTTGRQARSKTALPLGGFAASAGHSPLCSLNTSPPPPTHPRRTQHSSKRSSSSCSHFDSSCLPQTPSPRLLPLHHPHKQAWGASARQAVAPEGSAPQPERAQRGSCTRQSSC
jgi:hypothetical protein